MAGRKLALETFVHYLTGAVVLVKAYDKSAHFDEHPFITVFLFLLGILIIIATIFHRYFDRKIKEFRSLLHACEFLVLLLVAYYYFSEGKTGLPAVYLLAAVGHLVSAVVYYRRKLKATSNNSPK